MQQPKSLLLILLLVFCCRTLLAGIRPSFSVDSEAWRSTDIVLASSSQPDGTFEVIEAWKGNLRTYTHIFIPQLIPGADAIPIALYPSSSDAVPYGGVAEQIPREPTGSHVLLFLKNHPGGSKKPEWEPANPMNSMKASVVWIEGGTLYSFTQPVNPGPSVLHSMAPYSLHDLNQEVEKVLRTQQEMNAALSMSIGATRAEQLKPYVKSEVFEARRLALKELGNSGAAAIPTIEEMLDDTAYEEQSPELIEAMASIGGTAVASELNRRFQREVAFWMQAGPALQQGWWNENPEAKSPIRLHYLQTYQLIVGLQRTEDKDALRAAHQLHDLWITYPQLNDPDGLDQISLECEKLIKILQS